MTDGTNETALRMSFFVKAAEIEQGLIVERTIALRPCPPLKPFRDALHASLKDKLPPVWDYRTPWYDHAERIY
jgi:hypothetical protein